MKNQLASVLVVGLAALLPGPLIRAEDKGVTDAREVRKEIESKKDKQVEAFKSRNLAGILENLAADYKLERWNGRTLTRTQMEANLKQRLARIKDIRTLAVTVDKLRVKEDEATVYTKQEFSGTVTDREGKELQVASSVIQREVWARTPQGWRVRLVEELYPKVTVNGQPVSVPIGRRPGDR